MNVKLITFNEQKSVFAVVNPDEVRGGVAGRSFLDNSFMRADILDFKSLYDGLFTNRKDAVDWTDLIEDNYIEQKQRAQK
jgi:hypothetical protein